jgi:hypothetical protein
MADARWTTVIGRRPGHVVPWRCRACGAYAPAAARFCGNCGAALARTQFAGHGEEHIRAAPQGARFASSARPTRAKPAQNAGPASARGSANTPRPRELPWSDEDFACLTDKAKSEWLQDPYEPAEPGDSPHVNDFHDADPPEFADRQVEVESDHSISVDDPAQREESIHADRPLFASRHASTEGLRVERRDRPPQREGQRRWSFAVLAVVVPLAAAIGIAAGNYDWSPGLDSAAPRPAEIGNRGTGNDDAASERDRPAKEDPDSLGGSSTGQRDEAATAPSGENRSVSIAPVSIPRPPGASASNGQSAGSSTRTSALRDRPTIRDPPIASARPGPQSGRALETPSAGPPEPSRGAGAPAKPGPAELSEARACANVSSSKVSASGEFVVWVQWALSQLGYQPGKADGMVGPGTRAAICAFQNNTGMAATGEIDDRLVERLRMAVGRASMTR